MLLWTHSGTLNPENRHVGYRRRCSVHIMYGRSLTLNSAYRRAAHYNVTHLRRQSFYALPSSQWTLLSQPPFNYLATLDKVDTAIDANADIADAIVASALPSFGLGHDLEDEEQDASQSEPGFVRETKDRNSSAPWAGKSNTGDHDKARSTLRQLYRDWSAEGASEREACYGPVLRQLEEEFSSLSDTEKASVNILLPGAGLGRLMVEIVKAGYTVEGNEISYHQLMTSSFILNNLEPDQNYPLYPFTLSFSNHISRANQLRKVMIPDVHPGTILHESSHDKTVHAFERMSMSAADFCVSYKELQNKEKYDVVATVFFIDTAPNLIAYIEAVWCCLQSGGIWINHGPLTWHFENNPPSKSDGEVKQGSSSPAGLKSTSRPGATDLGIGEPGSFELSEDEVLALVRHFGFVIEKREWGETRTGYIQDQQSMLLNEYRPSFWVARKK